ncbi:MAG: FtsW/RodA/SpoVE family cell cycle protein, partial [Pseudobdellovibrionaceae bacterium]
IILMVGGGLLFAFGLRWRYIIAFASAILPAVYFLIMAVPYRRARVLAFLDPWSNPASTGFQVIQSMLSFHSGGLTGAGIGQGQGKLFFLPEAHTDFTLAVFGEEMGFVGFLVILSLYGFVVMRGIQIAVKVEETFKKSMVLGFTLSFALSVFINAGVVMGLLPTKGLTLPFLSYGGSSLVVLCFTFGLILNVENSLESGDLSRKFRKERWDQSKVKNHE